MTRAELAPTRFEAAKSPGAGENLHPGTVLARATSSARSARSRAKEAKPKAPSPTIARGWTAIADAEFASGEYQPAESAYRALLEQPQPESDSRQLEATQQRLQSGSDSSQAALDATLAWVTTRQAYGAPLIQQQSVEHTLAEMARCAERHLLVSVPREPLWRMLNIARGAYIAQLGNTPGHLNHWSKRSFTKLLSRYGQVAEVRSPFPWTMLLVRL